MQGRGRSNGRPHFKDEDTADGVLSAAGGVHNFLVAALVHVTQGSELCGSFGIDLRLLSPMSCAASGMGARGATQ